MGTPCAGVSGPASVTGRMPGALRNAEIGPAAASLRSVMALLRAGGWESLEEIEDGAVNSDGLVLIRMTEGGTFIPFRDSGERTPDGIPVFDYALTPPGPGRPA